MGVFFSQHVTKSSNVSFSSEVVKIMFVDFRKCLLISNTTRIIFIYSCRVEPHTLQPRRTTVRKSSLIFHRQGSRVVEFIRTIYTKDTIFSRICLLFVYSIATM